MKLDFTLEKYAVLCQAVVSAGYTVLSVADYLANENPPEHIVILRHDVDRRLGNALRMAQLEFEIGLKATYYIRMQPAVFQPEILKQISRMNHEIGYHYETLAKAKGNLEEAILLFESELAEFRRICPVRTISMHGSPLSPYDNRDLWRDFDFRQYDLLGEAYLSLDYNKITYLTDTGRSWANNRYNMRDHVATKKQAAQLTTTNDLIASIRRQAFSNICISTHPERWPQNLSGWGLSAATDLCANQVKLAIRLARRT